MHGWMHEWNNCWLLFRNLILNLKFTEIQAPAAECEAAKLQKELDALITEFINCWLLDHSSFQRFDSELEVHRDPSRSCRAWSSQDAEGVGRLDRGVDRVEGQIPGNLRRVGTNLQWNGRLLINQFAYCGMNGVAILQSCWHYITNRTNLHTAAFTKFLTHAICQCHQGIISIYKCASPNHIKTGLWMKWRLLYLLASNS